MADVPAPPTEDRSTVSLHHVVSVFRHGWLTIVACGLVGLLLGAALFHVTPPRYKASSALTIVTQGSGSNQTPTTATEMAVVSSTSVAALAAKTLGTPENGASSLLDQLTVTSPANSQLIAVEFESSTANGAAAGANAFAQAYLQFRTGTQTRVLKSREDRLNSSLTTLQQTATRYRAIVNSKTATPSDVALAKSQLDSTQKLINDVTTQLIAVQMTTVVPGVVVNVAMPPTAPEFPKMLEFLLGGLMVAGLIGIVAVFIRSSRATTVADIEDLAIASGAQVLGIVPVPRAPRAGPRRLSALTDPGSGESDAYRLIASKLVAGAPKTCRSFVLTNGSQPYAANVALSLGVTFATQGHRVALIGVLPTTLHAAQEIAPDSLPEEPEAEHFVELAQLGLLRIISLGDEVAIDTTLRRDASKVADLKQQVDIIIIDAGNVKQRSTVLLLASIGDEAVVVASQWRNSQHEIRMVCQDLAQVVMPIRGSVLLTAQRSRQSGDVPEADFARQLSSGPARPVRA